MRRPRISSQLLLRLPFKRLAWNLSVQSLTIKWKPVVSLQTTRSFTSTARTTTTFINRKMPAPLPTADTNTMNHLDWSLTAEQILDRSKEIIRQSKQLLDRIAGLPQDQQTFANVILPLAQSEGTEQTQSANCYFPQYVHPDKAIRDASIAANKALEEHDIESSMRQDVYRVVKHVYDTTDHAQLSHEDLRYLKKLEMEFRRNGLALLPAQQQQLKQLKKRVSELAIDFSKNINEDKTSLAFTRDELKGMPEDFVQGLKKGEGEHAGKLVVTMKYPDLFPILERAQVESVRKAMDVANSTRCKQNIALLEETIQIRQEMAQLLGYPNHAAFTLELRMAKQAEKVKVFLEDLKVRLRPLAERELETLRKGKQQEKKELGETFDGQFHSWDFRYYHRLLLEKEYQVNEEQIKEYFSMDTVTKGMLDLYQQVLGLRFQVVANTSTWHPDVQLYEVRDRQTSDLIGFFYLDLFPRDGKYTHAACFGLQPGFQKEDGSHQYPIAAMVANFSKPTPDKPSLLKHNEVVTFYHELGHVMHQLCSQTKWSRFHGTKVERDFVEAPSQMLENWCWEADILRKLSAHYQRKATDGSGSGEKIPLDLCEKIVRAKNVNAGLMNLRQIFFATFDMTVHMLAATSSTKLDTTALYNSLRADIAMIPGPPDSFPAATFGHIMGGYDAGYYGYLWSQVFSADMYHSRFKKEGIENGDTGLDYRRKILQPGGSRDGDEMLKGFLGREPTADAFLKSIGLDS